MSNWIEILVLSGFLFGSITVAFVLLTENINFIQTRVPFVPTKKVDLVDMITRVGILNTDFVLDLGSGNGKVLFVVERLTGARTRGIQRAGWAQIFAKLRKLFTGSKAEFISGDFFKKPWGEATVIYSYLFPPLMRSVGEKFVEECSAGTKLICRDFSIPQLVPKLTWQTPSGHKMYLYIR